MVNRHAFRADWHDYDDGIYFITVCCHEKKPLFGMVAEEKMRMNTLGELVNERIQSIPKHFANVELHNHVVMPNHIHILLRITTEALIPGVTVQTRYVTQHDALTACLAPDAPLALTRIFGALKPPKHGEPRTDYHFNANLSVVIGNFKASVTRAARKVGLLESPGTPIWQSRFHEHIVRNQRMYENIYNYICDNPLRWKSDIFNR